MDVLFETVYVSGLLIFVSLNFSNVVDDLSGHQSKDERFVSIKRKVEKNSRHEFL